MRDDLAKMPRGQRRKILADEAKARKSGEWGAWETIDVPAGTMGRRLGPDGKPGWTSEVKKAHRNGVFCVLDRMLDNGVRHLAICSLSNIRPSWHEAQRIKDELAGQGATAIEIYPPHSEIVDGADMYHLWVLRDPLPFGLCHGD